MREANQGHVKSSVAAVWVAGRDGELSPYFAAGDVAVIDVADLDRRYAEYLISVGPLAVLNTRPTVTGRRPTLGATTLLEAGVLVIDDLGADLLQLRDGETISISGAEIRRDGHLVASGTIRTPSGAQDRQQKGSGRLALALRSYAVASGELFEREQGLITEGAGLPNLGSLCETKTVLVIAGQPHGMTMGALRRLLAPTNCVVIAVGALGMKAARQLRRRPDVVVGDPGNTAGTGTHHIVLLRRPDGSIAGGETIRGQAISHHVVDTALNEQEIALLLAGHNHARTIIEAGPEMSIETLVDSGGSSFNGSLLVHAELSDRLVSAPAALSLQQPALTGWLLALMVIVALLAIAAAIWLTPWGQSLVGEYAALSQLPSASPFSGWVHPPESI